jgi:D-alanyl-D-alanine carboxypeptidase/D-alanyl-D-alanine-endopeptidase (penicillin-binding protein 4)
MASAPPPPGRLDDQGATWLPRPRDWRLLVPVVLLVVCVASAAGALALDAEPAASAVGDGASTTTPVLSARRTPDLLAEPVAERRLAGELEVWLGRSPADSCLVVEDGGEAVFARNPTTPLTGASTQKLLTATALLLALGPEARLETTAMAAEPPAGGVVAGNLYLVGGGDPVLGTTAWRDHFTRQPHLLSDVERLAQAIADAGVTRVEGGIVGDDSRYDDERYHPAWPQRFAQQLVVGPIDGLTVNDGFSSFPSADAPGAPTTLSNDPGRDAATVLTFLLQARGVEVGGPPRSGQAPDGVSEVASLPSPTVAEIVADMLSNSDNETAEAALKEVGHAEAGEGSWSAGAGAATDLLRQAEVPLDGVAVRDGSGLSIENRLTCAALVDVLTRPETAPVVRDGLSVAGETGTLADLWNGTPVEGRLRAKTGTLRNVTALAGEVDLDQGGTLTFAYVANVPDPGLVTSDQVGLIDLPGVLMAYPRDVDLAQLEPTAAVQGQPGGG